MDNNDMSVKLILIDIDNTLLDFDAYVLKFIKEHFPEKSQEAYHVFQEVNDVLWRQLEKGELTFTHLKEIRWNMILDKMRMKNIDGQMMEDMFRNEMKETAIPVSGAKEMLEELSRDYILATASNGPYQQQVHRIQLAGFDRYFTMHFISEDIGYSKPDKRFFTEALARFDNAHGQNFAKDEILILGDSLTSDMQGGRNAGIHTCFYTGGKKRDDITGVDLAIERLQDAGKVIKEFDERRKK